MNHLIAGVGQIGTAVLQLLEKYHDVFAIDKDSEKVEKKIDIIHICFPWTDDFIKEVKKYQKTYKPKLIIIYSTVPIGTTKRIKHAVHSPVEGKHPRLYTSIKIGLRWIGYNDNEDKIKAQAIWRPITLCESVPNSDWTEFLKLASTSKYGINIVWADYMDKVSKHLKMPYDYVKEWDMAYNELYGRLRMKHIRKYVLEPPQGPVGGHCILPNAEILNDQFPNEMLKMIGQMK